MSKPAFKTALASFVAAAVISAAAISSVASAEPVTRSVGVAYADLDLTSKAGQQKLERRIARAARTVCGIDETVTGTRLRSADAAACYDQATRNARSRIAAAADASRSGG